MTAAGKKTTKITWYIEPIGEFTNRALANVCEGEEIRRIVCSDGVTHAMWQCPLSTLRAVIESSVGNKNYKFKIFRQKGTRKPEELTFLFKNRRRDNKRL